MSGFVWAVKTGDLEGVKEGVNKGENVNAEDGTVNKRTPLHHAADFGQAEVINFLVSKGAKVDTKDAHGITPLLAATYENHAAAVAALLAAGADWKIQGPDGQTAFQAAEQEDVKEVLRRAGAK